MDSHEHEPSYYEVALTNRQVVAGFVILLACLFAAFLSGVWLGKEGAGPAAGSTVASMTPAPEAGEAKLDQLTFFGAREAGARSAAPAPAAPAAAVSSEAPAAERSEPTAAEVEAERLRKTLEAEMALNRATPAADAAASEPPAAAAAGARVRRRAEARANDAPQAAPSPPPADVAPGAAATWIQVYSSTNGPNAQKLAGRLRKNGFQVAVQEAPGTGDTTYRVRVGPYASRDDADRAAARLRREFRLDTWVTDQP